MESEIFELEIITQKESRKIPVLWIEVESQTGNFVVGAEHFPLFSLLKYEGKITYQEYNGKEVSIDTYGGLFKTDGNKATAILD